jgi:hypothetical protein
LLPTDERLVQVKREEHIWDAAFATGISCTMSSRVLPEPRRKLESPGEVDQSDSLAYFPEDREAGFILPCTGKPRFNLKIRTHQQSQMRQFRKQHGLPARYCSA